MIFYFFIGLNKSAKCLFSQAMLLAESERDQTFLGRGRDRPDPQDIGLGQAGMQPAHNPGKRRSLDAFSVRAGGLGDLQVFLKSG